MFQFGTNEVIVGRGAHGQFVGLGRRQTRSRPARTAGRWSVSSRRTARWRRPKSGPMRAALQGAYRRGNTFQSVLAQLDSDDAFTTFRDWLTANPQLNVQIRRENEYYAGQSQALTTLIRTIGYGIAGLMGIGAVFGAILTMYTAVATRAREIATLRALGLQHERRCWCRCSANRWRSARWAA